MTPVFLQLKYFLNTVAIGLIIGLFFDLYRAIRFKTGSRIWTNDLLDLIVSFILTIISFMLLLFSNWGEVRFYVFLGIGLGLLVYLRYCSKNILVLWLSWLTFLVKSCRLFITISLLPLKFLKQIIAFPLGLISLLLFRLFTFCKPILAKPGRKMKAGLKRLAGVFHRDKKG